MSENYVKEYYEKNKEWLRELSLSAEPIVRAIALTILKRGAPNGLEQSEKA